MDKIVDKLKKCKDEILSVEYDNETNLEDILNIANMYMSELKPNDYITLNLNMNIFRPNVIYDRYGSNEHLVERKKRFINITNVFLEEYEIDRTLSKQVDYKAKEVINSKDVFIIHGWDNEMKESVARVISELDFNPIILHEREDLGRTIIEKFETLANSSGYAIALLSPDDICINNGVEVKRARQNVVFELGYFTGLLGCERT